MSRSIVLDGPFAETRELVLSPSVGSERPGSYAHVNGLRMYYEVHGRGRPVVLLHASLNTIDLTFGNVVRALGCTRKVIAIEQQAHGRTGDISRALSYEQMADDTAELLRQLAISEADFFGFSMGAAVGLRIASRHPGLVRKLVLVSGAYDFDGYVPEMLDAFCTLRPFDPVWTPPLREEFERVGALPAQWEAAVRRTKEAVLASRNLRSDELSRIRAETLLLSGTSGIVRPDHIHQLARALPRAHVQILAGEDHHPSMVGRSATMLPGFLDASIAVAS